MPAEPVEAGLLTAAGELCAQLARWALAEIAAGAQAAAGARTKGDAADWVTDTDLSVERQVREAIAARFPGHALRGEEHGRGGAAGSDFTWCIDPVDGSCNFAHRIPWYAFSIALLHGEEPVAGAVADCARGELVTAVRGRGLQLAGRPFQPPAARGGDPAGGVVTLELANARHWPGLDGCLRWLEGHLVTARIMGSSALAVTQAALGRAEGAVLGGSDPIDVGAAVLLAREAGLRVLGADGRASGWPRGGLVAARAGVAEALWGAAFGGQTQVQSG